MEDGKFWNIHVSELPEGALEWLQNIVNEHLEAALDAYVDDGFLWVGYGDSEDVPKLGFISSSPHNKGNAVPLIDLIDEEIDSHRGPAGRRFGIPDYREKQCRFLVAMRRAYLAWKEAEGEAS